jgi:hypothetical protein
LTAELNVTRRHIDDDFTQAKESVVIAYGFDN